MAAAIHKVDQRSTVEEKLPEEARHRHQLVFLRPPRNLDWAHATQAILKVFDRAEEEVVGVHWHPTQLGLTLGSEKGDELATVLAQLGSDIVSDSRRVD